MAEPAITAPPTPAGANVPESTSIRDFKRESDFLNKVGVNPAQAATLSPEKLYEAVYSPDELTKIPEYNQLKQNQQRKGQLNTELSEISFAGSGSGLSVLEDALREVSDVGKQDLGESNLFKQAGLTNFNTLRQSMAERNSEMKDRYGSFVNQLARNGQFLSDTYNVKLNEYNRLASDYDKQQTRLNQVMDNILAAEKQINLLNRQAEINKEMFEFEESKKQKGPTIDQKLKASEQGKIIDELGNIREAIFADQINFSSPGTSLVAEYSLIQPSGSRLNRKGVDFAGKLGSPITSNIKGTVTFAGNAGGWGNRVTITDKNGYQHTFNHLNDINVESGQEVNLGQVIGGMGNTGSVITTRAPIDGGPGGERIPSDEERKLGYGTHLDYTVFPAGADTTSPAAAISHDDALKFAFQGSLDGIVSADGSVINEKDAILAQIKQGRMSNTDISAAREKANKEGWLKEFTEIVKSPKIEKISSTVSSLFNVPAGITEYQLEDEIERRELEGHGNRVFQGFKGDSKEMGEIENFIAFGERLDEIEKRYNDLISAGGGLSGPVDYLGLMEDQAFAAVSGVTSKRLQAYLELEAAVGEDLALFIKDISGTAASDAEVQRLKNIKLNMDLNDDVFSKRIENMKELYNKSVQKKVARFGFESPEQFYGAINGQYIPSVKTVEFDTDISFE